MYTIPDIEFINIVVATFLQYPIEILDSRSATGSGRTYYG